MIFSYGNGTNSFYRLNRHLDFDKVKKRNKLPTESETKGTNELIEINLLLIKPCSGPLTISMVN